MAEKSVKDSKLKLIEKLKINDLMNNIHSNKEKTLQSCLPQIIDLFGSTEKFLSILITPGGCSLDKSVLSQMYEIIKSNSQKKSDNNKKPSISQQQREIKKKKISFVHSIPMIIHDHIVTYLQRVNIKQYKSVCRCIAISCLKHMDKHTVKVLYAPETLNILEARNISPHLSMCLSVDSNPLTKTYRYPGSTLLHKIADDLSQKYNIPPKHLLICKQYSVAHGSATTLTNTAYPFTYDSTSTLTNTKIHSHYNVHRFILCDKRQLSIINNTDVENIYKEYQDDIDLTTYRLKQIHYFDVWNQKMFIIGYVLCQKGTKMIWLYKYLWQRLKCLRIFIVYIHIYIYSI